MQVAADVLKEAIPELHGKIGTVNAVTVWLDGREHAPLSLRFEGFIGTYGGAGIFRGAFIYGKPSAAGDTVGTMPVPADYSPPTVSATDEES